MVASASWSASASSGGNVNDDVELKIISDEASIQQHY